MRLLLCALLVGLWSSCGYVFPSCETIPPCPTGQTLCTQASCSDLTTDRYNCGSCGNVCSSGFICGPGADGGPACLCPDPRSLASNGACVDLRIDNSNCGTLGNACTNGEVCVAGACGCPGDGGESCLLDGGPADAGGLAAGEDGGSSDAGADAGPMSDAGGGDA